MKKKTSVTSLTAVIILAILIEAHPTASHRLITNPYPISEWDSVIVSSDPIKVTERKQNETIPQKLKQILKPQKRSYSECPENDFKCLYGDSDGEGSNHIVDKFLEQYSEVNVDDREQHGNQTGVENESDNSRKSYWNMVESQSHHHPFDDKKGWVTLDPVPWSASKISKWHPNKVGHQDTKPWEYGSTTQRPVQQFWVSGANYHTHRPNSQWGIGSNDIITDNKPSGFPTGNYNTHGGLPGPGGYEYPGNYKEHHQSQVYNENQPPKFQQNAHPSNYPSNGNGEWILLSTTKGYSIPHIHRWSGKADALKNDERSLASRKIKPGEISRYHEEDLSEKFALAGESSGNRKSDVSTEEDKTKNQLNVDEEKKPLRILYTGAAKNDQAVRTIRRKVRLHVLPSLEATSTSHGGLLEVGSNSQTVEESQREDEKMKKLTAIANVKKNRIRGYKLVPTSKVTGKGMSHSSAITLAAVGAGMIPATMAILVPMALGRKKRSLRRFDNHGGSNGFLEFPY